MRIKMAWADFGPTEKQYLNDVIDSGWISRRKYLPRFEQSIAKMHGQKFGLMMNSGTDALRIALATLQEVHQWKKDSEVIVPAVTFVATVNCVIQTGLRPVFVDVDPFTYNMEPRKIVPAIGKNTVAVMPVHLFGLPADIVAVTTIAKSYRLKIIEDSCETMGVHKIQGDMAAFSTYMAHMIQTGVGGVLTTNNPVYDKIARSYMNHGRSDNPNKFEFERIGYSSRATEMEAALGCAQLERFPQILAKRQSIAKRIESGLRKARLHAFMQLPHSCCPNSWMLYPMVLFNRSRDRFMEYMLKKGIETRQMMPLINQKPYQHLVKKGQFPIAEAINEYGVCLPCHQKLSHEDVDFMVDCVKGFFS